MKGTELLVREADDLLTTTVDGDLIGLSIERGICYGFNAVATRAWEMLAEPQSVAGLCEGLLAEFDVDGPTCRRQMEAFLNDLRREKLIRVVKGR